VDVQNVISKYYKEGTKAHYFFYTHVIKVTELALILADLNPHLTIDRELLAGVKVLIGDWVYDASLKGQLTTFMTKVRRNQ